MSNQVRITVLKRLLMDDIVDKYAGKHIEACSLMNEGDTFITDGRTCPPGFCTWAFADIFKDILLVRQNADCSTVDKHSMVASCTDGFRPVIFLVEPYDE